MNKTEAEQYIEMLAQMRKSRRAWESGRFGQEDFEAPKGGTIASSAAPEEQPDILQGRTPKLDTTYVVRDGVLIR